MKEKIEKILLENFNINKKSLNINENTNIEFGHFSFPLFPFLKDSDKSLDEIFVEIKNILLKLDFIADLKNYKNFCNIFIKEDYLQSYFIEKLKNNNLIDKSNSDLKIMLEYSSPNPGKSFHIGHLRNTLIGQSVFNLYKEFNFSIYAANYLNDTGLHMAKLIWYFLNHKEIDLNLKSLADIESLFAEIYAKVYKLMEENPEIEDEIRQIYHKIENHNNDIWKILDLIKEISKKNFESIYKELNVNFDYYFYDSEMLDLGKDYVQKLLDKNIAYYDDGAVIVNLEKYKIPNALILKSDGTALYITKDLALARKRFEFYDIQKLIYVVGVEQKLHFQQVFKILELDGFEQSKNCQHLSYELLQLKEGKMGSRYGNVISYRQFRDEVFDLALQEIEKRYSNKDDFWKKDLALKIALSAIKIWILKYDNNKKITFDIEQAIDFAGDTGPYLLYTVARLNSLLKKSEENIFSLKYTVLESDLEKELFRYIMIFNKILIKSRDEGRPSILTNYILDLAKKINHYYHEVNVLKEENQEIRDNRLLLLNLLNNILKESLRILTVDIVEQM